MKDDSLARFVGETVDLLERRGKLAGFYEGYRKDGWGHPAYHPRMLVKVLVYGYCMGVTSSRKLAAGCENEVALRYLTANQQPDFRKDHLTALNELFVEVLGLVNLGRVALDGRKIAGNASLEQNRDEEWLKEEVGKLLAEALERIEEKKRQAMVNQERMERKLLTKRGREAHKQRGSTIEPVFGQMVMRGLVRFMLRGSNKVRAE